MKFVALVFLGIFLPVVSNAQTFSCPSGTEDMLNYFVMGYPMRVDSFMGPGNANPIYSSIVPDNGAAPYADAGYFVWTKSAVGYPWDIKTWDSNYVYDRTTELSWTDPTAFKRFNQDLPMSRRCVPVGSSGGTLKIANSKTSYQSYGQCTAYQTQNLGYVVNTISAPALVNVGNVGTVKTRSFTYKYSCDSSYSHCKYKEVFSLGYQIGLFDWKYYANQNGTWVFQQESVINNQKGGQTTPSLPCSTSYQ
ncbi:MAG TPA: hypothetical protein VFI95_22505 [Terriglobales bacterium]|nr:hypothetical protein [Terriglobales bacterium]